jgi:4-hydroxymandelate oxidase
MSEAVFTAGPPGGAPRADVRVSAVARRAFPGPPEISRRPGHDAHLRRYLVDLLRPYGLALRNGARPDAAGHSYGEMAAALIDELVPPSRPVGLLVLAFAVPDVRPGRATATYLSHRCPGRPLAFAVCDQGAAAAFTALRLVREYAGAGGGRGALLVVVEQAGVPYDAGPAAALPAAHTAVALRCDETGPVRVGAVSQYAGVAADRVPALVAEEIAAAAAPGVAVTPIVDAALAAALPAPALAEALAAPVRVAAAGRPVTGVWWELAGAFSADPGPARLVLAAHDRHLGCLSLSTFDAGPRRPAAPAP